MEKTSLEKITKIKDFLRKSSSQPKSVSQVRQEQLITAASIPQIPGIITEKVKIFNLNAVWIIAPNVEPSSKNVILYLHGGSFTTGCCETYRDIVSRISSASETKVLLVEYRLAPENKYPAANDDCIKAYQWLIENNISSENIIIGGDSIGGYLVLMTLLYLRNNKYFLPKAAFLLSPHTDFLYFDGESFKTKIDVDPVVALDNIKSCVVEYFGSDISSPSILSPLNEDLNGLPPLFIQVGGDEIILSDSTRLYEHARIAGVNASIEIWENMWHIFRHMAYMLPEGQEAIKNIGEYVKTHFHL